MSGALGLAIAAAISLASVGCAARPTSSCPYATTTAAHPFGAPEHAASPASIAESDSAEIARAVEREETLERWRTPPPRVHGKSFTTTATADDGTLHRVDIRLRDGDAETRVDGRLVPRDRVLVHRRGRVEILGDAGRPPMSFNLPRGMTSVANPAGR